MPTDIRRPVAQPLSQGHQVRPGRIPAIPLWSLALRSVEEPEERDKLCSGDTQLSKLVRLAWKCGQDGLVALPKRVARHGNVLGRVFGENIEQVDGPLILVCHYGNFQQIVLVCFARIKFARLIAHEARDRNRDWCRADGSSRLLTMALCAGFS
jgi:hypothetical protein